MDDHLLVEAPGFIGIEFYIDGLADPGQLRLMKASQVSFEIVDEMGRPAPDARLLIGEDIEAVPMDGRLLFSREVRVCIEGKSIQELPQSIPLTILALGPRSESMEETITLDREEVDVRLQLRSPENKLTIQVLGLEDRALGSASASVTYEYGSQNETAKGAVAASSEGRIEIVRAENVQRILLRASGYTPASLMPVDRRGGAPPPAGNLTVRLAFQSAACALSNAFRKTSRWFSGSTLGSTWERGVSTISAPRRGLADRSSSMGGVCTFGSNPNDRWRRLLLI